MQQQLPRGPSMALRARGPASPTSDAGATSALQPGLSMRLQPGASMRLGAGPAFPRAATSGAGALSPDSVASPKGQRRPSAIGAVSPDSAASSKIQRRPSALPPALQTPQAPAQQGGPLSPVSPQQSSPGKRRTRGVTVRCRPDIGSGLFSPQGSTMLDGSGFSKSSLQSPQDEGSPRLLKRAVSRMAMRTATLATAVRMFKPKAASDTGQDTDAIASEPELSPEEQEKKARREELMRKLRRIARSLGQARLFGKLSAGPSRQLGGGGAGSEAAEKGKAAWFNLSKTAAKKEKPEDHLADAWSVMETVQQGVQADGSVMALPTAADLSDLPANLRDTFQSLAMRTLRKYLYPKLLLAIRRKERKQLEARHSCPPMTVEVLRQQQMFAQCPPEVLAEVAQSMVMMSFEAKEFLILEGENAGSGIFFIMTGRVEVLKKKSRTDKRHTQDNVMVLVTLPLQPGQVVCVGEFSFLTEEPRMASVRAITRVDCWVLSKHDWERFVQKLQENKAAFAAIVDIAFKKRKDTMHLSYPMGPEKLCQCPLFAACPQPMLDDYVQALHPYAAPKDFVVSRGDHPADRIVFLQNGRCAVQRVVERTQGGERRRSATHVQTLSAPCVISDTAVLHGGLNGDTIVTLGTVDFWYLRKEDFDAILRRYPGVESEMMDKARAQRQTQLATQQNLFREFIHQIPFLGTVGPRGAMRELVRAFVAKVFKPMSVFCSTHELADRVIVVYKGRVRIGELGQLWRRGESAGYTCVVPHRWAAIAVTADVVECLELPLNEYELFLRKYDIYNSVVAWVKRLLFPLAYPPEEVYEANQYMLYPDGTERLRLFPRSYSSRVNLCEDGFRELPFEGLLGRPSTTPIQPDRVFSPIGRVRRREAHPRDDGGHAPPRRPASSAPTTGVAPAGRTVPESPRRPGSSAAADRFTRASKYLWRKRLATFQGDPVASARAAEADRAVVLRLRRCGRTRYRSSVQPKQEQRRGVVEQNKSQVWMV
eukprot:TRINITY_DN16384_c0_g1_i1.p1 TRINITY_DN16384_c0_g1~~TRINITY_DN16384_c0_g1_i1.p1  ORF type:complete len:1020 (+),score=267.38 TRINITY_DN16384_c0_g1_i1:79-3060(+)